MMWGNLINTVTAGGTTGCIAAWNTTTTDTLSNYIVFNTPHARPKKRLVLLGLSDEDLADIESAEVTRSLRLADELALAAERRRNMVPMQRPLEYARCEPCVVARRAPRRDPLGLRNFARR